MIMETTSSLYRQAVAYAVERLEVGATSQQIKRDLLTCAEFRRLRDSLDMDELYDCIAEILDEADDWNEVRLMRNIQPSDQAPLGRKDDTP
jgi:NADH/NAD ratio-sensing transcriptional regulator Rex